jgi:DNA-binding MurR/RpiR family transcriptional regulator
MTKFLKDILKQPKELIGSLHHLLGEERASLDRAASVLDQADHIYLTGIDNALIGAALSFWHRNDYQETKR